MKFISGKQVKRSGTNRAMTDYKALYEKEKKKREQYCKVIKKQQQTIKELKEENKNLKERLDIMKATASTHIQDINEVHKEYGDKVRKLKEKMQKLEEKNNQFCEINKKNIVDFKEIIKLQEVNMKLEEQIKEHKKELLTASLDGFIEGCSDGLSIDDEIRFLNQSGESQELIKEVFDEMYNDINLVYNIKTKDYEEIEEQ